MIALEVEERMSPEWKYQSGSGVKLRATTLHKAVISDIEYYWGVVANERKDMIMEIA